jgi:glycosyltransferase involved in cell wall biosynthesis
VTGLFSLVISAYDVAPYLDDFLASLAAQTYPVADLEIIFVDDGSTDASADVIASWIDAVAPSATLLRKENGGLSSARNAGLGHVTGSWVTFCDPDDILSTDYFSAVAAFIAAHSDRLDLVATRLLMLDDETRELRDEHPLRFRFEHGNQVVDLERDARYFHLSAASGFYRTEIIDKLQLRFDERIRPNFEDGHFTGLYLANFERPHVGIVTDAAYHYRRRRDASSLVQDSWNQPEKFTTIPRFGYLDLFAQVQAARGAIPIWLQNLVLYDVLWYLKHDERIHSLLGNVDDAAVDEFHAALPDVMRYIDSATIDDYHIHLGIGRDPPGLDNRRQRRAAATRQTTRHGYGPGSAARPGPLLLRRRAAARGVLHRRSGRRSGPRQAPIAHLRRQAAGKRANCVAAVVW